MQIFYLFVYICIAMEIQLSRGGDPINSFNLPHFFAHLKPGPRLPRGRSH